MSLELIDEETTLEPIDDVPCEFAHREPVVTDVNGGLWRLRPRRLSTRIEAWLSELALGLRRLSSR